MSGRWLGFVRPATPLTGSFTRPRLSRCRRHGRTIAVTPVRAELAVFPEVTASNGQRAAAVNELRTKLGAEVAEGRSAGVQEGDLEWFLRDRRYDVDRAYAKLKRVAAFRREYAWKVKEKDVAAEMASGKSRVHTGMATRGRPVLVVNVAKHVTNEFPLEMTKQLVALQVQQAVDRLGPGDETIMTIIDMRGFSLRNADIKFVKFLVDVFFIYYPRRMSELLLVSPPPIFRPTWAVVKPLLRKYASLVKFVSVADVPKYFDNAKDIPVEFK